MHVEIGLKDLRGEYAQWGYILLDPVASYRKSVL